LTTQPALLTIVALMLLVTAWIVARRRMNQSPFHLWLGSALSAIVAVLAVPMIASPVAGPIADLLMLSASLFAGYCFTLGVRHEATERTTGLAPILAGLAACLAIALLLELTSGNILVRGSVLRALIAVEYLSSLFWIPGLLRSGASKPATAGLAIVAALVAGAVLAQSLISAAIVVAAVVFVLFSVERAREAGARR
jgi:hypothetical protein